MAFKWFLKCFLNGRFEALVVGLRTRILLGTYSVRILRFDPPPRQGSSEPGSSAQVTVNAEEVGGTAARLYSMDRS